MSDQIPAQRESRFHPVLAELVAASTPFVDVAAHKMDDRWNRLNEAHLAACELLHDVEEGS